MNPDGRPWAQTDSAPPPSAQPPLDDTFPHRSWWPRRLHHQLALMVSLALVCALSLLGGFTAIEQAYIALHNQEGKALAMARQVAIASRAPLQARQLDQLEELLLRSADGSEALSLQFLSPHGETLSRVVRQGEGFLVPHNSPPPPQHPPGTVKPQVALEHDPERLVVWQPVVGHLLDGWVRLEYDTRELDALQRRIWRNTLVVAALAVTVCGLVLAWVLRGPVQALDRARQFATEITRSDGRQLPIEPGPIEVMQLNGALNEASMLMQQQMLIIEDWLSQHREHEARLAERNAQLGAIFSLSRDGLVTLNHEDRVLFANQAFMQLTGLQTHEVVGQSLDELSARLMAQAQPGSTFTGLCHAFQTAVSADASARSPLLVLGQGAQRCILSLTGQRSDSQAVSGVLYLSDVTRQHTLDQMKSEFLSMAAHELRTPMVSIFGFTELMLNREMTPERRKDLLGSIHRHCQSMVSILNELLDLARIESRRGQDFQFEQVDMADVVQSVLADFKPPAGRQVPSRSHPSGPMPVRADVHKLQQAVLNILSNAYKYSPEGGEVAVGFISQADEQGRPRHGVRITDHGVGLSPDDLARLGERFFRVDKSGNIPGTGLGVSIVKELMELMGGRMQVHSTLGQGTTVTLWL